MIDEIETVVNRDVLGKTSRHDNEKSGWKVPLDEKDKRKLGQVTLSNPRARKFRIGMKAVVDVCTSRSGGTIQQDWLEVCDLFETVWYHLDSRKEFKKSDVYEFQKHADDFCDAYIKLTGIDGMTNYYHFLHAGHFSWYLLKYKNL